MKIKNYEWGMGQRKTVQQMFRWGAVREPYPVTSGSQEFLRYDRMIWRVGRKPNRIAVGTIRAMGAQHFFRGCYLGAEDD